MMQQTTKLSEIAIIIMEHVEKLNLFLNRNDLILLSWIKMNNCPLVQIFED